MLILFDIDATMLSTSGAGMKSMATAGRRLYGPTFSVEGIDYSGSLDPLIIRDMFRINGIADTPRERAAFRAAYRDELAVALSAPGVGRALSGVPAILDAVENAPWATLGLLTGNFEESGRAKLHACGIDSSRFRVTVWGDESPHDPPAREHLPPVAMDRYRACRGCEIAPARVVVIGDTIHDVSCAKAHGCRVIGVATGYFSCERLASAGADHVAPDLSDTVDIMSRLERWSRA